MKLSEVPRILVMLMNLYLLIQFLGILVKGMLISRYKN